MPIFVTNALEWCVECTVKINVLRVRFLLLSGGGGGGGVVAMPNEENLLDNGNLAEWS